MPRVCRVDGCDVHASYGYASDLDRRFCSRHGKQRGCVRVISLGGHRAVCRHTGCTRVALFGPQNTALRQFCSKHGKQRGLVRTAGSNVCTAEGCTTAPSYGPAGTNKRVFCSAHGKKRGCVRVISKPVCTFPRCKELAYKCDGCAGADPVRCLNHMPRRQTGRIFTPHGRGLCCESGCFKHASFAITLHAKPLFCATHGRLRNAVPLYNYSSSSRRSTSTSSLSNVSPTSSSGSGTMSDDSERASE